MPGPTTEPNQRILEQLQLLNGISEQPNVKHVAVVNSQAHVGMDHSCKDFPILIMFSFNHYKIITKHFNSVNHNICYLQDLVASVMY